VTKTSNDPIGSRNLAESLTQKESSKKHPSNRGKVAYILENFNNKPLLSFGN